MRCCETIFSIKQVKNLLEMDGFVPVTVPFAKEMDRRFTPTSRRGYYAENSSWDGTKLKPSDYNEDGTLKQEMSMEMLKAASG